VTKIRWCACRIGAAFSAVALIGAFLVRSSSFGLAVAGWMALVIGAPVGMGLCLKGCGPSAEPDLTERTVAHTGVALSVLSLVVFVV